MFQSNVFFKGTSDYTKSGKRDALAKGVKFFKSKQILPNASLFAEGGGVTATSLVQRPSRGGISNIRALRIIHRVPSVEGVTATSLVNHNYIKYFILILEKMLQMSYLFFITTQKRGAHWSKVHI